MGNTKEIKNAPSALLSYISTWEFLRTREKCGEAEKHEPKAEKHEPKALTAIVCNWKADVSFMH